jgi:membrane-associated phospholipid phosphatase
MSFRSILAARRPATASPEAWAAGRRARFRPRLEPLDDRCLPSANVVLEWNQLAVHAVGQARLSPVFVSRDLAITQAAVYDAVVAIDRSFEPYYAHVHASHGASQEAAAAQAAHDALSALFPTQASTFDSALAADLVGIPPGLAMQGVEVGREVAQQILDWRNTDGSTAVVPYTPGTAPGDWQPTPPANLPALAPQWPYVTPFATTSGSQFRPDAPPPLTSAAYAAAFNEVKDLGSVNSTTRTPEQTQIARFWNDGLGTAFAMGYWNKIAQEVATDQGLSLVQDARLFALLNIVEADAQISCWDAKYTYNLWRPVTAIRAADTDGNPDTGADATWTPLLVTPNFPSYTSAHSTLSGAAAEVLTTLFGPDHHFTVGAESVPGVTRSFDNFAAAAAEAGQSRIYGGIHYQFDNATGQQLGRNVAEYVADHFLLPRHHGDDEEAGDNGRTGRGDHTARHGALDGNRATEGACVAPDFSGGVHGSAAANGPVVTGAFAPVGGDETGLAALVGGVPVDCPAQGGVSRGGADSGLNATAAAGNSTPRDNRTSGTDRLVVFASTEQDDVFGDPDRL